ncbi:glycosyltransferase 87 family protein [Actinoplanes sp. CA-030573]|uniref:glycosyltransferase 87 family protein n=1 Tax=Actinoplanes sp. CA-030573 TaxID=3239898 RepID=UPI003D8A3200
MKPKIVILSLLVALTLLIDYLAENRNRYFDSKVYYGAIQYWFHGDGGMVYDWMRPGTPYGFTYPPFAGLLMSPMAVLPYVVVVVIAVIATVLTTALLTWWFAGPMLKRWGQPMWFGFGVAICLALSFEPVRETISFGQVNTLLLTLVAGDMLFGVARGRRWAGAGIGLATAIKLTPGVFILYLLITKRWRAAAVSAATAAGATLLGGAVFPDETREFWTSALWDTNRVGVLSYVSNQSERGFLARLPIDAVPTPVWLVCVLLTLGFWALRVRREPADVFGGLALSGVVGCLISPVTWVHHCVWLIPALIRCADHGLFAPARRDEQRKASRPDRRLLGLAVAAYLIMTSRLLWAWEFEPFPPLRIVGSNLYVYFTLALLVWTPMETVRSTAVQESDRIVA